jgi:hypothetical protein
MEYECKRNYHRCLFDYCSWWQDTESIVKREIFRKNCDAENIFKPAAKENT